MSKQVLCPICLSRGDITITIPKDDAFFECPVCRCGTWPPEDDIDFVKRFRQQKEVNSPYRSCSLPEGVKIQGGGDSVGASGKDKMKKKTLKQINQGLGGKSGLFEGC